MSYRDGMGVGAANSPSSAISVRRQRTRDQILATLSRHGGGLTRAEISRLTGLSASAVSDSVASLHADGLVAEHRRDAGNASSRGRPSAAVTLAGRDGVVIGVDIGHAHIAAAVATTDGVILRQCTDELDVDRQPGQAMAAVATLTTEALRLSGRSMTEVLAMVAGIPGPRDIRTGLVSSPTMLPAWAGIAPAEELERRIGRTVVIGNDADMGARGEQAYGAARGIDDFLYIKVSHGIGAGIVLGGHTYQGSTGIAGEIGHTQVPGATNWCRCGSRGCLETVVSITAVRQQLMHVQTAGQASAGGAAILPPGTHLDHDPAAARVLADSGRTVGRVVADLVNCLNPSAVILGGELGASGAPFAQGVRESIDRHAQPASAHATRVLTGKLGLQAELRGAIASAIAATQPAGSRVRSHF